MNLKLQELVTNKRYILLQIIKLISEEEKWYSVQEISESIRLVERSVQRYVNDLSDTVTDCNQQKNDHFIFQMKKNKGVRLIIEQRENVASLERFIYESDDTIRLLIALLFDSYESTYDYCQKTDVTSYALSGSFNKINHFLHPINLKVSPTHFCIVGSEAQIRLMSNSLAWYLFNSDSWPTIFHQVDSFKFEKAINTMIHSLHLDVPTIKKREVIYMIVINILRYRKGSPIDSRPDWNQYVPVSSEFELNKAVETMYNSFHIFSNSEVRFVVLNLITKSFVYTVSHLKRDIVNHLQKNESDLLTTTSLFMKEFDQIYSIPLNDYDDIYFYILRGHLVGKLYKQADFNFSGHSLKENIPSDFSNYYYRMVDFINQLWTMSNDPLFLEKEYLISLYFLVLSFTELTSLFEQTVLLSLESDLPEICEKHIEDFICNQFKHYFNIVFTKNDLLRKPDLILTTISLKEQDNIPSLAIDYPISDRTMLEIKEALSNITDSSNKRAKIIINTI